MFERRAGRSPRDGRNAAWRIAPFLAACVVAAVCSRGAFAQPVEVIAAQAEEQALETALTFVYLDTGYFVALEALDDLATSPTQKPWDYINRSPGTFALRPEKGYFDTAAKDLRSVWQGPYASYQQGTTQLGTSPYDQGTPLDPWSNPYYLFGPLGMIRGDTGAVTQDLYGGSYFDRYAIVSLGPDGVMSGDDVIRLIGASPTSLVGIAIASLSGPDVTTLNSTTESSYRTGEGNTITISGYNFGATQGAAQVMFGGAPVGGVTAWSASSITVQLPAGVAGTGALKIQSGAASSNELLLTIVANGVETWVDYE